LRVVLDHSCQVQRHPFADRGLDLYETPAVGTEAVLRAEQIPVRVWEPCADRGAISRVLQARGYSVISSDIFQYDYPLDFVADFLAQKRMPDGCDTILTNPPYKQVEEIVAHAITLAPRVIMLLRLAFFEGGGGRTQKAALRRFVLDERPPARVHCFRLRLPMMHRDQWAGKKANSGMAFGWWIWERGFTGPTTAFDRISWEK
jgi:hypothetical protein